MVSWATSQQKASGDRSPAPSPQRTFCCSRFSYSVSPRVSDTCAPGTKRQTCSSLGFQRLLSDFELRAGACSCFHFFTKLTGAPSSACPAEWSATKKKSSFKKLMEAATTWPAFSPQRPRTSSWVAPAESPEFASSAPEILTNSADEK